MIRVTKLESATIMPHLEAPRGQSGNVVRLPPPRLPNEVARLRQAAAYREEFADCVHMALACLLGLAVTLAASVLLRGTSMQGEIAHYLQAGLHFLAAACGFTAMLAVGLALVHFIRFRQL